MGGWMGGGVSRDGWVSGGEMGVGGWVGQW